MISPLEPNLVKRAYLVLSVIAIGLSIFAILYGSHSREVNNHKFCRLITTDLNGAPVPKKPANPVADPSRERIYENYNNFRNLGIDLGCVNGKRVQLP